MVNTIFILDSKKQTSQILSTKTGSQNSFWDDLYTQEFDTGAESFEFTCNSSENIKEGNYVAFFYNKQYKLFSIMEVEQQHKNGRLVSVCYCETSVLELLNHYIRTFSGDKNCIEFFQYILQDTGWAIGRWNSSLANNIQTVNIDKITSVWSLIEEYKEIYECEINVRVAYDNGRIIGQYIDLFSEGNLGDKTYKRFEYGRNVTGITKNKDLYDWCTGIIIDCDCDVTDKTFSINNGDEFDKPAGDVILNRSANEKYNNGRPYIMGVYSGKETDPTLACTNAWKELIKRSEPKFDYEVDTALTSKEYEEINLGDTVHVIDNSYTPALLLEARVGTLELSFTDKTKNKCTLTNYKELKSAIGNAEFIKLTGTITDVVNTFFPVGSDGIADGAIIDGKIETTYYKQITADIVSASTGAFEELYAQGLTVINADIENLKSNKANISDLTAINADIDNLRANKADVSSLTAINANIDNLRAGKADITDLNAANGNITNLTSQVGQIETIINGHFTGTDAQVLNITAQNTTIDNAVIKNAMIDTVSADKVNAGTINTNNVVIESEDGGIKISGATQQFKDKTGTVRVQIGKDASGNFTFCLFSQDGTGILLDETGIKAGAVPDGLIVNNMVADNANISGNKLDISSVITSINNNTTSINSSSIKFDDTGQTLQVAFNELKTKVETIDEVVIGGDLSSVIEQVTTNTTNIGVMQGQISSLISNTTITKEDGTVTQLKDEYNATKDTVNSHTTKIGSLETNYNKVSGDLASVTSKQSTLEQSLDEVSSILTATTTTANEAKTQASTNKQTIDSMSTTLTSTTNTANSALNKATTAQQNLDGFKTTVSDTYTTKTDFNNLSIGGRNLVANSAPDKINGWSTNGNFNKSLVDCTYAPKEKAIRMTAINDGITSGGVWKNPIRKDLFINGEVYTVSAWIRASKNIQLRFKNEMMPDKHLDITTEWKRYTYSSTIDTSSSTFANIFYLYKTTMNTGDWFEIHSLELEKGGKATDWTPAPEDIDDKFTKYSTTEQMTSAIDQKAGEITSTVSSTYTTKGDFENLETRTSQIKQDVDAVTYSFKNSCANLNLLHNGKINFYNHNLWTLTNVYLLDDTGHPNKLNFRNSDSTNIGKIMSPSVQCSGSTKYSISFKYYRQKNVGTTSVILRQYNSSGGYNETTMDTLTTVESEQIYNKTITTKSSSVRFNIIIKTDVKSDVTYDVMGAGEFMVIKGDGLYPLDWYPAQQEIMSDITTIDGNGVTVKHSTGDFSRMNGEGFMRYINNTGHTYRSMITAGSVILSGSYQESFTITLPEEFDNIPKDDLKLWWSMECPETSYGVGDSQYGPVNLLAELYMPDGLNTNWKKNSSGHWTVTSKAHYAVYKYQKYILNGKHITECIGFTINYYVSA